MEGHTKKFTPKGQLHPQGTKFTPGGEVENCPKDDSPALRKVEDGGRVTGAVSHDLAELDVEDPDEAVQRRDEDLRRRPISGVDF
jgi:hypothetical protein